MNTTQLGRYLAFETLKYCMKNGPSCTLEDIKKHLEINVINKIDNINEFVDSYDGHGDSKWLTILKFALVDYDKAGWFKKSFPKRGYWTITETGVNKINSGIGYYKLGEEANKKYWDWKNNNKNDKAMIDLEQIKSQPIRHGIDDAIETADMEIKEYIRNIDPYDFQDLVGALFESMGYFVDYISPKGRDGGVDLVCYQDPLGIKNPRMKVQVKQTPDKSISRPMLSEFADQLKSKDEVGIYVTTGSYSSEARKHAISHDKHIRLIDGVEFIDLIKQNYDNLPEDAKILIPLKKIFHLYIS